jgi:alkylhydroperoxidase/carboxymuconolactone decarboxylase family protein YurZ
MWHLDDITPLALSMLEDVEEGASLDAFSAAMIKLAVSVSVTSLNPDCIRLAIAECRTAGCDIAQIQEVIALVSGLGMHALMVSATMLVTEDEKLAPPLDTKRQALWDRYVGTTAYWDEFDREVPGFLLALLRVSPEGFAGFFEYCAIPWATRLVPALTKELAAMACDASPTHRFGPGFRLHLRNAKKLGAGRQMILQALAIARSAPAHDGVA